MDAKLEHRAGSYAPDPAGYAEPANVNATRSHGSYDPAPAAQGESVGANSSTSPILALQPTGSGVALARTLVRVLVRRAHPGRDRPRPGRLCEASEGRIIVDEVARTVTRRDASV